ncbi:hypothetical protein NPIL_396821 [Nephila pilipes]|uniref:Uncharacterized protein n=1 Tax=Nephila pilipes TaxID=299642 RepID=A0A8X6U837_NEPPI|nr:hypothetical protein NPIL_396821 [Nephila pilipes]
MEDDDTEKELHNQDSCLSQTRPEGKFLETREYFFHFKNLKEITSCKDPNFTEYQDKAIKFYELKTNLAKEFEKAKFPNQCNSHLDISRLNIFLHYPEESDNPYALPINTGTKIKALRKAGFQSPTKTAKQPRK